jgi:hypothetical protein
LALDATERRQLAAFADRLTGELTRLLHSGRPDWGYAFLVGLARLETVHESVDSGRLVVLDAFPSDAEVVRAADVRRHARAVADLAADAADELARVRGRLQARSEIGEAEFSDLEDAANRWLELAGAATRDRGLRVSEATLVPSRTAAPFEAIVPDLPAAEIAERLGEARAVERRYSAQLAERHAYDLFTRNCVSEIFRTVDAAAPDLGGRVDPDRSLNFIPFVSARAVNDTWDVARRTTLPSYRRVRVDEMSRREGAWRAWLREGNVVTSTIYRHRVEDSFFLLFTDDVPAARPLLGAVNVVAGLGASAAGLALLPVDRGRTLVAGLRGALFSLPELAFVNLRKGAFDYVRRADRPLDDPQ